MTLNELRLRLSASSIKSGGTEILEPGRIFYLVLAVLALANLVSSIDQSAIPVALPTIGFSLNTASNIVWANTVAAIGNTAFQPLHGGLSDIVGRRWVLT